MKFRLLLIFFCVSFWSLAQVNDTTKVLDEVVVKAYQYNRALNETPVAIGLVGQKELNRFNSNSIVSAMNTIPGVRMEERSPGSYRFAIRGSTLRSPFGIRNVKFYWNGLPLTDGGGNTYLNLLDFDAFDRIEIIKGPGASLYGAGTGGVVLLNSPLSKPNQTQLTASGGNFGLQRYQVSSSFGNKRTKFFANYAHQQAGGYRQQSAMRRDALNLEGKFSLNEKNELQAFLFYTDLYYQTPGGLTLTQFNADPRQARPTAASGTPKGSVQQQAAIYNKTIYGGVNYRLQWSPQWSSQVGMYGSYTDYTNPAIQNYERRIETNAGGRTVTQYEFDKALKGKLNFGGEYQYFHSPLTDYNNNFGVRDTTVQTDDRLTSNASSFFSQVELVLPAQFYFTAGGSINFLKFDFHRLRGAPSGMHHRNFDPMIAPRIALLKKINESFSIFSSVGKGFSTPTWAEVVSSTGVYNPDLAPEEGINYEAGIRGNLLKNFSFDVVAYDFEMKNIIIAESSGQNYINAGSSQKGMELFLSWQKNFSVINFSRIKIWTSTTFTDYKFNRYNYNSSDFSGKPLPSVAPKTIVGGMDLSFFKNFYCNVTAIYVDKIAVDDGNTTRASDYFLLGSRVGYRKQIKETTTLEIFGGIENALDQKYSLGNDINALGSRYFNAAATRNFYFGMRLKI